MTTWRKALEEEMRDLSDSGPVLAVAPDDAAFDVEFDDDYGSPRGPRVLAWTETRVYFPVCYDGAEWLSSAPRNPGDEGQGHVGSW